MKSIYKNEKGKNRILDYYNKYLTTFNVKMEKKYVNTSFGKTHVLIGGPKEGEPLFLFQGGNCINPMTLSWFTPLLSKYRVYAPDTIGHPGYSDETRMSANDGSFARWIQELMTHFQIDKCAFVGPSYGAGIVLRMASYMPNKISKAVLVAPAGIQMGSKLIMIQKVLIPLLAYKLTGKREFLNRLTDEMSLKTMNEVDRTIIGEIFNSTKLEQDMPKLTEKSELTHYHAPTLVIAGEEDLFFPADRIEVGINTILPNAKFKSLSMGHFPSQDQLEMINQEILEFLAIN
ncbi:alpha/beta fold hydrolase [Bacillus suaedaesalsae]|uniref:Alpha/beta hydrolase n=1 Tax=Bacillus suaedaesalsae TaxID=2810349 RepID=A0ABS2DHJ0_9BACI|nr:alpha/beta hydrolase [Bacillus suaedaesalsae]MBM6617947.1 alpha/beta hydrolase [Bacillus suaedaesalsae]